MDINIYYPFDIKFFDPIQLIKVTFINNLQDCTFIYYNNKESIGAIIPPLTKRIYNFPIDSIIKLYIKNGKKFYREIKLKNNMIYIIP